MSGQTQQSLFDTPPLVNLQWRAGQLSGQTSRYHSVHAAGNTLQWRAGQLSGQTLSQPLEVLAKHPPSMEGRTIVRPDQINTQHVGDHVPPSMEGRTIVRPDLPVRTPSIDTMGPSMEGRTIVRPD